MKFKYNIENDIYENNFTGQEVIGEINKLKKLLASDKELEAIKLCEKRLKKLEKKGIKSKTIDPENEEAMLKYEIGRANHELRKIHEGRTLVVK